MSAYRGIGVLGAVLPERLIVSDAYPVDIDSDHKAVDVRVLIGGERLVLRIANCEGVSERRPGDEARLALEKPGHFGLPDVVLFSEVSWLDVVELARRSGWHAHQEGDRGTPAAGVAVATREPFKKPLRTVLGSRAVPGVRARPIVGVRAYGVSWWAVHAPPGRNPVMRAVYIARAVARRGVKGGDWNRDVPFMKRLARLRPRKKRT